MSRLSALVLASIAALAAAAVVVAVPATATSDASPGSASNHAAARADAASLLARLRLPAGAAQSSTEPAGDGGALARPGRYPVTPNLVDDHQWWVVPGAPQNVLSYIERHKPAGATLTMTGGSSGPHQPQTSVEAYSWAPQPGELSQRSLVLSALALSHRRTGLRVDAEDVWISTRPASETVPAGVRAVSITVQPLGGAASSPTIVRSRVKVRRIVALVDRLPAAQPGVVACPADWGPIVHLAFLGSAGAGTLARVAADPTGCAAVSFWLGGVEQPALSGAVELVKGLQRAGVKLCVPSTQPVPGIVPVCKAAARRPARAAA
jgi:hypothetical protein